MRKFTERTQLFSINLKLFRNVAFLYFLTIPFLSHANLYMDAVYLYKNTNYKKFESSNKVKIYANVSPVAFFTNTYLKKTENVSVFQNPKNEYSELNFWSVFYFCIAFMGIFIAIVLNFKKQEDKIRNLLISIFVLLSSLFIIRANSFLINDSNHFAYVSIESFSFLYGPLLYFYFKHLIWQHKFKLKDSIHALPSVLYLIYVFQESEELNEQNDTYFLITTTAKLVSLMIYGYLAWKINKRNTEDFKTTEVITRWRKTILRFYLLYTISYSIYSLIVTKLIAIEYLYHTQLIVLSSLIAYIGYMAYVHSIIFNANVFVKNEIPFKYKKSGLTDMYSRELKENLVKLLDEDKFYKNSNITLELLSEKLETTRHNASQVINEHFNMNFFDLINKYRIQEAIEMLKNNHYKNLNIIEVAYEVGFNNKVTFNKAFKKETALTPTQYLERLAVEEIDMLKENHYREK